MKEAIIIQKPVHWSLYNNDLHHERVKELLLLMLSVPLFLSEYFQHLNTCLFSKLVSHSIKVISHCNFLKPFLVYVIKIMERVMYKKVSQQLQVLIFRFLTLPSDSGQRFLLIGFLQKRFWLLVGGGGCWWTYLGWWWVVVDIFWLVVGGGGWWWVVGAGIVQFDPNAIK